MRRRIQTGIGIAVGRMVYRGISTGIGVLVMTGMGLLVLQHGTLAVGMFFLAYLLATLVVTKG